MKSIRKIILITLSLILVFVPGSRAMTVYDPINAAINELQNSILNTEWGKEIALAIDHLNELKNQTLEMIRFHAGFDEIFDSVIGDPLGNLLNQGKTSLRDAFIDAGFITPQIEILEGGQGPSDIRHALEQITGAIPEGNLRPYIPFEEMMVVDAFDFTRQIREAGDSTRNSAAQISEQAKTASPKGSTRLSAQGISQLMILAQQNQEATAKLIDLGATGIEQVTRHEKEAESERIKYLQDANDFLEDHFSSLD